PVELAADQLQLRAQSREPVLRPGPPAVEGGATCRHGLRACELRDPARPLLLPPATRRRGGRGGFDLRAAGGLARGRGALLDPPGVEIPPRSLARPLLD